MKIRRHIMDCVETAMFPSKLESSEQDRLLHFVVVGGGPTGVEFSAELHDYVHEDLQRYFPKLAPKIRITVIQSGEHILNTFDLKISNYAEKTFQRENIEVITNARVIEVRPTEIVVFDKTSNKNITIPFGLCVWSAGIGPNPLITQFTNKLAEQQHNKGLVTDEFLRVKGVPNNNIYALGDCATVTQKKLMDHLVDLFQQADLNHDGVLSFNELRTMVSNISSDYPQLLPFAHGIKKLMVKYDFNKNGVLELDEFKALINDVDKEVKTLPTTAQAASQAGRYLGKNFNQMIAAGANVHFSPFMYQHLGSFAYVGGDKAVADLPNYITTGGFGTWWFWRSTYFSRQFSWRNRVLITFDWLKAIVFGRDVSRV